MLVFGAAVMLASAGVGGWICWANRAVMVHVQLAGYEWTGHLYGLVLAGATLTGWFVLGAACVQLRLRERRDARSAERPQVRRSAGAIARIGPYPHLHTGGQGGS